MNNASATADSANTTADDLRALIRDAEQALQNAGDLTDDKFDELRDRFQSAVGGAKSFYGRACAATKERAAQADKVVRSHPYESIGIALGAGVLLGYFISRR
ncbi:MAG: DUF883 domain-containing protein [Verrucomicrobia bacterium]|nr:DUF883 domain-containing protein [Verrucomicrobiota bacterium]